MSVCRLDFGPLIISAFGPLIISADLLSENYKQEGDYNISKWQPTSTIFSLSWENVYKKEKI